MRDAGDRWRGSDPGAGGALSADLAEPLARSIEVGLGNVLFAWVRCSREDGSSPAIEIDLDSAPARLLGSDLPLPGELREGGLWVAAVAIEPVEAPRDAVLRLSAREPAGGVERRPLGTVELLPGDAAAARQARPGRVAVCLAAYEAPPELLRRQLDSIRNQSHRDWVCLIRDDASSPQRRRELGELVGDDERFQVTFGEQRLGFYRNFERVLRMVPADAEFVALADQDDRWHPDKLAELIGALGPSDVIAHSDARVVDERGRVLSPTMWPRGAPLSGDLRSTIYANPITGAAALFRADLLPWILPLPALPGNAFHDRWIALIATALGGVAYLERPLYDYVQHGASVLGHAGVAGASGSPRARFARRLGRLRAGGSRPDWRAFHDGVLLRTLAEAMTLRLRAGERLDAAQRAALTEAEALSGSGPAQLRLLARHLRRPSAPGLEGALLRGVAWPRLARARSTLEEARGSRTPAALRDRSYRIRRRGLALRRIGITVSGDAGSGFGDVYVGGGLGAALGELGYEVVLIEPGRAGLREARAMDVVISLLDRFPADRLPASVVKVAWARNWIERWSARGWLPGYDLVIASSEPGAALLAPRAASEVRVLPLATDPRLFRPGPVEPELACDVLFAGSNWGAERAVARVLPELAGELAVTVFGEGWDHVPGMRELSRGPIEHHRLAEAYRSAALVVDDSAPHTAPYGAVNSRVFDALACAANVCSNDPAGVEALFGEGLPTWSDSESLARLVQEARSEPAAVAQRVGALREQVLAQHTFAQRARQLDQWLRELAPSLGRRPPD